jgi:cysteine sulfinate desulfinase/cysteine desulfurase-like protein
VPDADALCALRVSLGWDTTEADIDRFISRVGAEYTTAPPAPGQQTGTTTFAD